MDVCGLSFKVTQDKTNVITEILENINLEKYQWKIDKSQEEIYTLDKDGISDDVFFEKEVMKGKELKRIIQKPHYVLFVKIVAFPDKSALCSIDRYADYLASDCELILFIYDCEYVEIYTKSINNMNSIINNCVRYGYANVELISEQTRNRELMIVR